MGQNLTWDLLEKLPNITSIACHRRSSDNRFLRADLWPQNSLRIE